MKCCLKNCRNNGKVSKVAGSSDWITFHMIPKDPKMRAAWLEALSIPNWMTLNRALICSDHFKEDDFVPTKQGRRVKKNAVPFIEGECAVPAALRACRVCLAMDLKMYQLRDSSLAKIYIDIVGILPTANARNRLPMGICWQCTARLEAAAAFKAKALFTEAMLHEHLKNNADLNITDIHTYQSDHTILNSSLTIQEVFKFSTDEFEEHSSDTEIKSEAIGIPHNEEVEVAVQNILTETITIKDERKNVIIEEACPISDVKTEVDLIPKTEVNIRNSQIDFEDLIDGDRTVVKENVYVNDNTVVKENVYVNDNTVVKENVYDNDNTVVKENVYVNDNTVVKENVYVNDNTVVKENMYVNDNKVGLDNIVLFKREGSKDTTAVTTASLPNKICLGNFVKDIFSDSDDDDMEVMVSNDDVVSGDDDDAKVTRVTVVSGKEKKEKIKTTQTAVKREGKRSYDDVIWVKGNRQKNQKKTPYVKPCIPLDENVFTVKNLDPDELRREVEARKESEQYILAPYKCDVCYKGFPTREKQARHVIKHSEESGPIKCDICYLRMMRSSDYRAHMKRLHASEYICKLCPLITRCRNVALGHVKYHEGNKFECPQCSIVFEKKTTLLNHLRLKHMSAFVCELCGYTFVSKTGVDMHKRIRHKLFDKKTAFKGQYCDVCDVKFLNNKAYRKHLRLSSKHISEDDPTRISNDPSIKQRKLSTQWLNDRRRTRRPVIHRKKANSAPANITITCEQCGVVQESLRAYISHFKYYHPGIKRTQYGTNPAPYMCEHCGKLFLNTTTLSCHMWVHTGEKRFQCDHCNKTFTIKANLAGHMQQHEGVRKTYDCRICGKQFTFSYNRTRHMFQHTDLRPYKCEACDKNFRSKQDLGTHVDHVHLKKPRPQRVRRRAKKCEMNSLEY